jgi:hypothetical protein
VTVERWSEGSNPFLATMNSTIENYPELNRIYKHYKGGRYEVISMATHTETDELMVVYKSLLFGSVYVRPLKIWNETVLWPDNQRRKRFVLKED